MSYLFVGIGNIGPEYVDTRHNAGFMVLDELAKKQGLKFITDRHASYSDFRYKGRDIYLIKPTTFVNLSGKAVQYWLQQLKIPLSNVLIIVDDIALPFGKLRLKPKGGDAGHNGLKSIQASVGSIEYARLRFGVGNNFKPGRQVDYVLSGFDPEELPEIPLILDRAVTMCLSFATIGTELTMTQFNQ